MKMLQDPTVKPPDVDMLACSRPATSNRQQKGNSMNSEPLKCPRCDSSNTKFCYYNNYSLTQPRHYCKSCRRHWTNGGSLRNVPIGGGCRKMKRVKHRSADPNALLSLDETAANMLASIGSPTQLPHFSAPLSSNFSPDKPNDNQMLNLAFSRLQESLCFAGSSQNTAGLLNGSCSQLPLMSGLPDYDNGFATRGYGTCNTVKLEHGAMMNNGSDLCSAFDCRGAHMAASATATLASLEDQLSSFSALPADSFDSRNLDSQWTNQPQKLALQLASGIEGANDRGYALPAFEDETHENMTRHIKRKSIISSVDGGSDWQQQATTTESLFDPSADYHNFSWSNHSAWPDMHALTSSTAGALL